MDRSRAIKSTSPARRGAKSPTRKSPTKKSTGRQRSKSPSRKSPSRKSPSRKSPARKKSPSRRSPARNPPKQQLNLDKLPELTQARVPSAFARSSVPIEPKAFIDLSTSRSTSLEPQLMKSRIITEEAGSVITAGGDSATVLTRRSMRILTQKPNNDFKKEVDENVEKILKAANVPYSDGHYNNSNKYQDLRDEPPKREFGGILGVLLFIIVVPSSTAILLLACTKNTCVPTKLDRISYYWKYYLNPEVAAVYLGFIALQMLLSVLPIGKISTSPPTKFGSLTYRVNGLLSAFLTVAIVGGLYYYGYPVTNYIDKSFQLFSISFIVAMVLSIALFIKGGRTLDQSPHVDGNKLYDFFMGREINPRFGPFDVKILLLRVAVIGSLVMNVLLILKSTEGKAVADYPFTQLLISTLQIMYLTDWYLFEDTYLTTFEIQQEAVGYMSAMGYLVWPYIFLLQPKFLYYNRTEAPFYILGIVALLFSIGYVIYRGSNAQKGKFRKNPSDPKLAYLETIPTSQGKKLICGGWWGWVRHPNYLGDIIMNWALVIGCGTSHWLPYFLPVAVTMLLVHRAVRDNGRCKARYGSAWDRYTHKVKYNVIPRVF